MKFVNHSAGWAILLVVSMSAGCGDSADPGIVPVSGIVLSEGRPVEGASVVFHPLGADAANVSSMAVTGADGGFELKTHAGRGEFRPGAAPGRYAVVVTKLDTKEVAGFVAPPKNLLPKKYGDPKTSGLTAEVAAGKENHFEFPLASE